MIARASGFGMRVGRFSRPLRGVGVLAMPDAGLDTTRRVESVCVRGSGNRNRRRCLHLDQWSLEGAASIDLVTPT